MYCALFTLFLLLSSGLNLAHAKGVEADTIVTNAKVFTHNKGFQNAFAVKEGKFLKVGSIKAIMALKGNSTKIINAEGKTIIPGLIDTHMHPIRAGLNYNLELRWDGVKSLKKGLEMISEQAKRTPDGQWIRVVGSWSPHQFEENRMPTLEELNKASPDKPLLVLYLYSRGFLNKAGLKALGYSKETKYPGGELKHDEKGEPTGYLIAKPSALVLYKTLSLLPKLQSREEEKNSTILFFRELSRFGLTTAIDAGGGGFFYPEDHRITKELLDENKLAVHLPFFIFAPTPGKEIEDFKRWVKMVSPATKHQLEHLIPYFLLGGGEQLTASAGDFENFLEPRPELPEQMESELKPIMKLLFKHNWIFRIHATYDESIARVLNVLEEIKKEGGEFPDRFIIDHAETVSVGNLKRIKLLGGGISIQDRLAFQGEEFTERYGKKAAEEAPPINKILSLKIPLGSGTDATRVSSYNPWIALYWKVTGKTVGGFKHMSDKNTVSRKEALYLMSKGAAWFSKEEKIKGDIAAGEVADFAILNKDYFTIPEEEIKKIESVMTVVGGKVMYGTENFESIAPAKMKAIPEWSPVNYFGGYQN